MDGRLFLAAALLCSCAGEASENSVSRKILVFAGETAILPCHINVSGDFPTVEWSIDGRSQNIAFLYRDGCETYEMKNPAFRYRTNLIMNKLKNGNISLRISNVQLSDAGTYRCRIIQKKAQEVVTMELIVGAVSEPKLSVVPAVDGEITLQCEANCWFPEPEITLLDGQGSNINAENPKSALDSRGCFTVTRRVTVQTATSRITCRVHQPKLNQTRVTGIYIPDDCMKSCTLTTSIAVAVTVILCGLGVGVAFACKKCDNCVWRRKFPVSWRPSDQGIIYRNTEAYRPTNQADDIRIDPTEHQRKMDELKLNLRGKEEIIRQLTKEINDLRSKQSPVVCQQGQFPHDNDPKPASICLKSGNLPQKKDSKPAVSIQNPAPGSQIRRSSRNHSSPALLTDNVAVSPSSSSAFASEERHVCRSRSLSDSHPRPSSAKSPRRNTTSALSNNPFGILANLPEDSELLLS